MNKRRHRYSGNNSTAFWARVGALKNESDNSVAYSLGCVLQNLEEYVLQQLAGFEKRARTSGRKSK